MASPLQFLSDFESWLEFKVLQFFEYGHSNIRDYLFWALIPALTFLLYRIFRSSRLSHNEEQSERIDWPGLDSEFYKLEHKLAQNGLPRRPGEPLSAWLRRATEDRDLAEFKDPLEELLLLHYRHRFDPCGLNPADREALRRKVESLLSTAFAT